MVDHSSASSHIHITVRLKGPSRKTNNRIRFSFVPENVEFSTLLQQIAAKLGVPKGGSANNVSAPLDDVKSWRLLLGGDHLIEETSEIDEGDRLVFDCGGDDGQHAVCDDKAGFASESDCEESDLDGDRSDEGYVEDVTDQHMSANAAAKSKMMDEADLISDDDKPIANEGEFEEGDSDDDILYCGDRPPPTSSVKGQKTPKGKRMSSKTRKKRQTIGSSQKSDIVESPIEVIMDDRDVPVAPGKRNGDKDIDEHAKGFDAESHLANGDESNDGVESSIKQRIIKLLNTGFHETSNEHEAKNAMKLARRLMQRHNLSQAMLLRERDGEIKNEGALKGGLVTVFIVKRKTRVPASLSRWNEDLIAPVCANFKVEAYKTVCRKTAWRKAECSITFYGIYSNTQLAGYAFKIASERIGSMASSFIPNNKGSKWLTATQKASLTKTARLSYALGIVRGITNDVEASKQKEEEKRKDKLRRARTAMSTGEAYEESDNADSDQDLDGSCTLSNEVDFTESKTSGTLAKMEAGKSTTTSKIKDECTSPLERKDNVTPIKRLERLEQEENAALALVEHHERIAKEVLKDNDVKVRGARKRKAVAFDRNAYDKGVEDAKDVDLNQRAIRDHIFAKKEKET